MAFANSNVTDLIATGIEQRSRTIADNVLNNNPITWSLNKKGRVKPFSGGHKILEELSFASNSNGAAFSGYDTLPTAANDVISASEWNLKQYGVPVAVSGLEMLQNAGKEQLIDLVDARLDVAEATMANMLEAGAYGDGTGYAGKAIVGMAAIAEATATGSQTSTVGGISRTTWAFWRSYYPSTSSTATDVLIRGAVNTTLGALTRGSDKPDLVILGATLWGRFLGAAQALQRFTSSATADAGFMAMNHMGAEVVLGGGINGPVAATTGLFINTKYLKLRPHSACNMKSSGKKEAVNQDAYVQWLLWAGALTCSGAQFQGRFVSSD